MPSHRLLFPDAMRTLVEKRFNQRQKIWLAGDDNWPQGFIIGSPTEQQALADPQLIQDWISAWHKWDSGGEVSWQSRRWRQLGTQPIPISLIFESALQIAQMMGQGSRWLLAVERYGTLVKRWPTLNNKASDFFDVLYGYSEVDFERLLNLIEWLIANQYSGLYPRQIPVAGVHTKWFEKRASLLRRFVTSILLENEDESAPVSKQTGNLGLKSLPAQGRIRLLDLELRSALGGLSDVTAPIEDLAELGIQPRTVFIVENLQTFLAFTELTGSVAVLGMGYSVQEVCRFPWIQDAACFYWGDIDTHGFVILDMARSILPNLKSILMDEATLLENRALWSDEERQSGVTDLARLNVAEHAVYTALKNQNWGTNVRLEQERVCWPKVWMKIEQVVS